MKIWKQNLVCDITINREESVNGLQVKYISEQLNYITKLPVARKVGKNVD